MDFAKLKKLATQKASEQLTKAFSKPQQNGQTGGQYATGGHPPPGGGGGGSGSSFFSGQGSGGYPPNPTPNNSGSLSGSLSGFLGSLAGKAGVGGIVSSGSGNSGGGAAAGYGQQHPPAAAPAAGAQQAEAHPRPLICSVQDFLALRDSMGTTPHGGVVLFLHALLNYVQHGTHQVGKEMLVLCLWEECLVAGNTYKGYALAPHDEQRLAALVAPNDLTVRSYVAGATPEQGYSLSADHIGVRFQPLQAPLLPTATDVQLHLWSSGADAPRAITLRKNKKGFWKVLDFTALLAPVRAPGTQAHPAPFQCAADLL